MIKSILGLILAVTSLNAFAADKAIDAGKKLFETSTCITCHGLDAKAQTDTGKALKARNLVSDPFKKGTTEKEIAATISKGIEGTGMAGFPNLKEEDRKLIAKYILSLRAAAAKK